MPKPKQAMGINVDTFVIDVDINGVLKSTYQT